MTKFSDLNITFGVAEWNFSKLTNSFGTLIVFINTYGYCASAREGFIEFCRQDVEFGRAQLSQVMDFWSPKYCENDDFQMSWESKSGGRMHHLDTPGVFLNDSGGWRMTLWNFNFRSKVSSG